MGAESSMRAASSIADAAISPSFSGSADSSSTGSASSFTDADTVTTSSSISIPTSPAASIWDSFASSPVSSVFVGVATDVMTICTPDAAADDADEFSSSCTVSTLLLSGTIKLRESIFGELISAFVSSFIASAILGGVNCFSSGALTFFFDLFSGEAIAFFEHFIKSRNDLPRFSARSSTVSTTEPDPSSPPSPSMPCWCCNESRKACTSPTLASG
mmetsp:Transcript_10280/g.22313  ORF Transcript_10280/g.22313 Transcript_10280/m.22313 type:complete len:216 (+) Transcript_10280:796-1443(+)